MSHRHGTLLRSIFHDPPSGNVHWRDVESLLKHVGAKLEPIPGVTPSLYEAKRAEKG